MDCLKASCEGVRGQGDGWVGSALGQLWLKRMETESAVRKAAMAWELVMVLEGGSDDRTTVGRGRAPALQAKRRAVRRCIFGGGAFVGSVVRGPFTCVLWSWANCRYS